jgi:hypothetical protein
MGAGLCPSKNRNLEQAAVLQYGRAPTAWLTLQFAAGSRAKLTRLPTSRLRNQLTMP